MAEDLDLKDLCQVCMENKWKYRCPKCHTKSCSLECVKTHKAQSECDGEVDKTQFVKRTEFHHDPSLVQRDYNFLIGLDRMINVAKQDIRSKNRKILHQPNKRFKIGDEEGMIVRRGVNVKLLPKGMQRSNMNKSSWDKKKNTFVWTMEFVHLKMNGEELGKYVSYRVPEGIKLTEALHFKIKETLPVEEAFCFLKLRPKNGKEQLKSLDKEKLIADLLRDETVIEFPTIVVSDSETVGGYVMYESDSDEDSDSDSGDSDTDSSDDSESDEGIDNGEEPEEESSKKQRSEVIENAEIRDTMKEEKMKGADPTISNIDSSGLLETHVEDFTSCTTSPDLATREQSTPK